MNIYKQDVHSVFPKYFMAQGEHYLAITVMSAFSFDDTEKLLDETDLWSAAGSALSNHDVLDMFMPKQKGEVLAAGKYFSPGRKPVRADSVRISVGSVNKTLHVFGDRCWIKKAGMTTGIADPKPMTEMDITYENAFGGPGYEWNTLGKGIESDGAEGTIPLPNIEYADQLIGSPSDRPKPAGFGPLGPDWQQRAGKLGTYDRKWLETRWPWYPEDMDWTYFNAASEDQQIAGYFTGDENIVVENMHPERYAIKTLLPGLRMRCFVRQEDNGKEIFKELKTRLDTVWLFPEHETGVVIWRATIQVQDDDATDIHTAYVVHEFLIEPEKPIEYYRDIYFAGIEEEETAEEPESQPPKEEEPAIITKPMEPPAGKAAMDPEAEAMIKELEEKIAASEKALMNDLKERGIDIEQIMKELPVAAGLTIPAATETPGELSLQDLEKELARGEAELQKIFKDMGADPNKLMGVLEQKEPLSTKELIEKMQEAGINDPETEKYLLEMEKERAEAEKELAALLEEEEKREAELKKEEPSEEEGPEPEPEEVFTREKVIEDYEEGRSFSGKDLSGLDLARLDLNGIDLKGAILENVNFAGTNLTGADLSGAVLTGAVVDRAHLKSSYLKGCLLSRVHGHEADMSHSDLSDADITESDFSQGNFEKACMDNAILENSKLEGARFKGASAQWTVFTAADLRKTDFRGADITRADFTDADIQNANFAETVAHSATFEGATGKSVNFEKADLRKSRADDSTRLERADLQKADLSEANWEGANLTSSILRFATLTMTDLSRCNLPGSDFYRAVAKKAKFSRADLTDADMTSINLFRGDLTKAKLVRTDLKGSNLFEVEFLKATVNKTNFQDANLKRTKLARWVPK
ncbi:MAG: DUF2169 domain-containing protein [Deltaproteobacteria bacterium]|nr:DUF2169 domain-containing protein [Deltaproteobacteria bacterium]